MCEIIMASQSCLRTGPVALTVSAPVPLSTHSRNPKTTGPAEAFTMAFLYGEPEEYCGLRRQWRAAGGTIQRYIQSRKSDRGYQKKRRILVVVEARYVIVFNDPQRAGKRHEFVTAFPADMSYLERIKRQSFLAETVSARKPGD